MAGKVSEAVAWVQRDGASFWGFPLPQSLPAASQQPVWLASTANGGREVMSESMDAGG